MSLQITASKTALFLGCQRPFDPEVEIVKEDAGEAANYGNAFHESLEAVVTRAERREAEALKKWNVNCEAAELAAHVDRAYDCLVKWMAGDNVFEEKFRAVDTEKHLATAIRSMKGKIGVKSRECAFDEAEHHYDLRKKEIGGTYDLLIRAESGRECVIDYKSGDWGDFQSPAALPQMRTLALQTGADCVAILHAPRNLPAVMYAEEIDSTTIAEHARAMVAARRRIGDGSLRPGPHCKYCEARSSCPAKDGELLIRTNALVTRVIGSSTDLSMPLDKGKFHMLLGELDKLSKRARDEMKNDVLAGEVIERPDGKCLVIEERSYERLSKASVVEALGQREGEKMLIQLRKKGCLTTDTRKEMHARAR